MCYEQLKYVARASYGQQERRNTTRANDKAQAIHRMVDAMQPIVAPPRAIVAPTRPVSMEDFMKHRPTKFSGKATPDEANAWLRECEKICRVLECTNAHKLSFVTFLLVADAEY